MNNNLNLNKSIIRLIRNFVINFLIIMAFAGFFDNSLHIDSFKYGIYASFLITLLNRFLKPILVMISILPILLSFGIFLIIINAVIIEIVSSILAPNFEVSSFSAALFLSIIISVFSYFLNNENKIIIKKF